MFILPQRVLYSIYIYILYMYRYTYIYIYIWMLIFRNIRSSHIQTYWQSWYLLVRWDQRMPSFPAARSTGAKDFRLGIHNSTRTWFLFEAGLSWDGCAMKKNLHVYIYMYIFYIYIYSIQMYLYLYMYLYNIHMYLYLYLYNFHTGGWSVPTHRHAIAVQAFKSSLSSWGRLVLRGPALSSCENGLRTSNSSDY